MLLHTLPMYSLFKKLPRFGLHRKRRQVTTLIGDDFLAQKRLLGALGNRYPTILDIGANEGQTALKYRSIFPNARILCFEPYTDSFRVLSEKLKTDANISVIQLGISDTTGKRDFFVNYCDPTNSLLPRPMSLRRYYPSQAGPKSTTTVNVTSIDQFLQKSNIQQIDIVKLDIQGGELMALQGAVKLLRSGNVSIIYSEIMFVPHYENAVLFYQLCKFLTKFGYSLYDIYNLQRAGNGQLRYGDAIFVSSKLRKRVIDTGAEEP